MSRIETESGIVYIRGYALAGVNDYYGTLIVNSRISSANLDFF